PLASATFGLSCRTTWLVNRESPKSRRPEVPCGDRDHTPATWRGRPWLIWPSNLLDGQLD
ncbi:MAG: hypothetical protein J7M39_10030, partial [Anaerolineae bacterium]|nr:hypothetical protein [Anaerolineae bacterium]